jgi:hypothetical protein
LRCGKRGWPDDSEKMARAIDAFRLDDAADERHVQGIVAATVLSQIDG